MAALCGISLRQEIKKLRTLIRLQWPCRGLGHFLHVILVHHVGPESHVMRRKAPSPPSQHGRPPLHTPTAKTRELPSAMDLWVLPSARISAQRCRGGKQQKALPGRMSPGEGGSLNSGRVRTKSKRLTAPFEGLLSGTLGCHGTLHGGIAWACLGIFFCFTGIWLLCLFFNYFSGMSEPFGCGAGVPLQGWGRAPDSGRYHHCHPSAA